MLRGMCTVTYFADDVAAARRWYAELLGIDAYFVRPEPPAPPAYVEFRVGEDEDELGILDRRYSPSAPGRGTVLYWNVDDVVVAVDGLVALGATPHEPVTERGPGFVTASVIDPFGNILGVMENAHYAAKAGQPSSSDG
jgi:predicted enzyme related to lactoylglutathione lyase